MEIDAVLQSMQAPLPAGEQQQWQQRLEVAINHLINNDFNRLVQLLYTIDIDELRLKRLLQQQPQQDAAQVMATLIIARQQEKRQHRQPFTHTSADDEERW